MIGSGHAQDLPAASVSGQGAVAARRPGLAVRAVDLNDCGSYLLGRDAETPIASPDERARAETFANTAHGRLYLTGHIWLRLQLSRFAGRTDFEFAIGPHGKPQLSGAPAFSFARSGAFAALACFGGRAVGVDIERDRRTLLTEGTVARMARLLAREPMGRGHLPPRQALLRAWTALEAVVKRDGGSMAAFLDDPAAPDRTLHALRAGRLHVVPLGRELVATAATSGRISGLDVSWCQPETGHGHGMRQ